MDATPIIFDAAVPVELTLGSPGERPAARKWAALHEAAAVVAALARVPQAPPPDVPAAIGRAPRALAELAEQGIEDLAAVLAPGLTALLAVHARGGDPAVPARALWEEFVAARAALAALLLPRG